MKFDYYEQIKSEQNGINYDPDSSPRAWEYYRHYYSSNHWKLLDVFDINNVNTYNRLFGTSYDEGQYKRLLAPISKGDEYSKSVNMFWKKFTLGGETDFNFNQGKIALFKAILGDSEENKEILEECQRKHHTVVNFSLMAATGGLNIYKGRNRFDRFDVFVRDLNNYYLGISSEVLSEAKANLQPLKNFLSTFSDIYGYCQSLYFIRDKDFVDRIIDEGKLSIKTVCDVKRYMKLAKDYWNIKEEHFNRVDEK
jgi:hypothetical protein